MRPRRAPLGDPNLVVDGFWDTAERLRLLLEGQGHAVRTASNISQGLKVAESYEFDVLVSDIGLPDGPGTELLARVRSATGRPILGIAMSGCEGEKKPAGRRASPNISSSRWNSPSLIRR